MSGKRLIVLTLGAAAMMIIWAIMIVVATANGWLHSPLAKDNTRGSFVSAIEREIAEQFVGNFAMAMIDDGIVVYEKFYSRGKRVDRNTVFQVASLSKWVSAFGVMKLVEEGKLELDAPVSQYLTRWHLPPGEFNNEVTVRRLLSHTAGLTDGLGYSGFENGARVQSIEESLTKALDADAGIDGVVRVGIKPGSEFRYSGGGYTLLQLLVEEVTGQSFASYMRESVFGPLGMMHSAYRLEENLDYSLAEFYNADGTKATHLVYTSLAATSLYTTLSDLELFFQAHLPGPNHEPVGRKVLTPQTLSAMRKPHAQKMGVDIWGLGAILYAPAGSNDFIIGHDGKGTPPVNTAVRLDPVTGDGVIILATGHPMIATTLASEWVFWKTGKVDTFLFPLLISEMVWTIGIGWVVIIFTAWLFQRRVGRAV